MGLIKSAVELEIPSTIKAMIYGVPGMGKTTLALSAPKPLLLDFDGGVKRVNMSHLENVDTIPISNWNEASVQLFQENLAKYETIVIDTIGKMMDYIIYSVAGNYQPTLKQWGTINQEFSKFTRNLSMLGKNIIFVAHRSTRKEGDNNVYIPDLREKNYNAIVTELDLLGYMEMQNIKGQNVRTITFDPSARNDGKNTCNLPACLVIPNIVDAGGNTIGANDFVQQSILKPYAEMLAQKKAAVKEYEALMSEIKDCIEQITDANGANDFIANIDKLHHIGSSRQKASVMLVKKANQLNLYFNKETRKYEPAV